MDRVICPVEHAIAKRIHFPDDRRSVGSALALREVSSIFGTNLRKAEESLTQTIQIIPVVILTLSMARRDRRKRQRNRLKAKLAFAIAKRRSTGYTEWMRESVRSRCSRRNTEARVESCRFLWETREAGETCG